MGYLGRLSISTKNGLFGITFSFIFGITVLCTTNMILSSYLMARAQRQINTNAVLARTIVELKYGTDYKLIDDRLYVGTHRVDNDVTLVDQITQLFDGEGDVMTIFQGDIRIQTNVRDPKTGLRAIGTKLAQGPAYEALFRDKTKYQGEVQILGEPYLSAYDPILDREGNVIGIFFVGLNKAAELAIITRLELGIGSAIVIISVLMAGGLWTISYYRMKPVQEMAKIAERLRQGDTQVDVPSLNKGDEIGTMAHAIQAFKEYSIENKRLQEERSQAVEAYTNRAEEIIRLQEEKQHEMESNAKRAEQLIEMQTERVFELAQKEKRTKLLLETNAEFEKSIQCSIDLLLSSQKDLNETAEIMSHNVTSSVQVAQAAAEFIKKIMAHVQSVASSTEELTLSYTEILRQISRFSEHATNVMASLERGASEDIKSIRPAVNEMAAISLFLLDQAGGQKIATAEIGRTAGRVAQEASNLLTIVTDAEKVIEKASVSSKNVLASASCLGAQSLELDKTVSKYIQEVNRI